MPRLMLPCHAVVGETDWEKRHHPILTRACGCGCPRIAVLAYENFQPIVCAGQANSTRATTSMRSVMLDSPGGAGEDANAGVGHAPEAWG
jgi:hypothetical protein